MSDILQQWEQGYEEVKAKLDAVNAEFGRQLHSTLAALAADITKNSTEARLLREACVILEAYGLLSGELADWWARPRAVSDIVGRQGKRAHGAAGGQ